MISPTRLATLSTAAALIASTPTAPAQSFGSPAAPGGVIDNASTIFRPQWIADLDLVVARSSPMLADVNGDGTLEIIVGTLGGKLYVLNPINGQPLPGWPQQLSAPINSTPSVGDVDGDGLPEIVVGCGVGSGGSVPAGSWSHRAQGAIYAFNPDGSVVLRHQTVDWWNPSNGSIGPDGYAEAVIASPALGNLDLDPALEIVVGSYDMFLYALNATGGALEVSADRQVVRYNTQVPGRAANSVLRVDNDNDGRWDEDPPGDWTPWPAPGLTPGAGDLRPGLRNVDDDGDGLVDEQGIDHNRDGHVDERLAHPFDDDEDSDQAGTAAVNWARVDEDPTEWPHHVSDTIWASPALADLDGNGFVEIIQPVDRHEGSRMYVLDNCACPLPGWENVSVSRLSWTPTTVGDLEGDGQLEILMGTNVWYHPQYQSWHGGNVLGLRANGTEILDGDRNPSTFGIFSETMPTNYSGNPNAQPYVFNAPVLGDIDGDGFLEVVAGAASSGGMGIFAWNHDGSLVPGFPVHTDFNTQFGPQTLGNFIGGGVIADLDGDGDMEIAFVTTTAYFVAVHHNGQHVAGSPFWSMNPGDGAGFRGFGEFQNSPAVGDIDNDGKIEIVFAGRDSVVGQGIGRVYCIEAGPAAPHSVQWPMEGANAQHTGLYSPPLRGDVNLDGRVDAADLVALRMALGGDQPLSPETPAHRNALVGSVAGLGEDDFEALVTILLTQR